MTGNFELVRLQTGRQVFEKKLAAIGAFKSQKQFKLLVDSLRKGGSVEYYRAVGLNMFNPHKYQQIFDEAAHFKTVHYH